MHRRGLREGRAARAGETRAGSARPSRGPALAALLLRLGLAAVFLGHGAQKLFGAFGGEGLGATASHFAQLGLEPAMPLAIGAGLLELAGGVLLWLGLWTRPAALLLLGELGYAFAVVEGPRSLLPSGGQPGLELGLMLGCCLAAVLLLGPGMVSLDASRKRRRPGLEPATAREP